ncbi:MAG TPA: glycosyltransferase [Gemmatimonadales bacterium]|nr:glycosyltransferase [Gemmatimonadales bacterium]
MRVVHVFKDYHPPTPGGIEQHMQLLCTALARDREVAVLVPSRSRHRVEERVDGVQVVRVPEFGRYAAVPLCPTMPRELQRLRPELVHLHFPNPMGDLAYLLAARRVPLVISYHADVVRQRWLLPGYRPLMARTFAAAHWILAGSPEYLSSSDLLSAYRDKCTIVPYGVDVAAFALRDGEAALVARQRERFGAQIILFVGALRHYKGLDVLLGALRRRHAHAVIVGAGPMGRAWRRLARELGVADRASFLGAVSDRDRRILLHACDVLVLPSIDRREAFGIAQLEAMACGKPVIASDLPTGVRFVNQDGITGFLVPPRDEDALVTALGRVLDDAGLRARLGQAARARVAREFTAERMVERIRGIYDAMQSAPRGAPAVNG